MAEGFADRAYQADGRLVPRREPGRGLSDVDAVVARAVRMATWPGWSRTTAPSVAVPVGSLCVHGDTPARWTWPAGCGTALEGGRACRLAPFVVRL